MLKYLSICSGIEAVTQAWHDLGYEPIAFAEIEPFPSAVLAYHYPGVPNLGDMSRFRDWDPQLLEQVDILVGGTPCQAFSVAGLRNSLDDERGNLTLTFVHLYDHITAIRHAAGRPAPLLLWENVPGVLNTPDNALGCFLGGLAGENGPLRPPGGKWHDAGYVRGPRRAIAWRILDAQYFGLAQRRERVFVVAGPRDHFHPEQVLFEWHSLRRDTPPRREPGQSTTGTLSARTQGGGGLGTDFECADGIIPEIPLAFGGNNTSSALDTTPALNANRGCHNPGDFEAGTLLITPPLTCRPYSDNLSQEGKLIPEITHTLRGEGFDASEDSTGRGTPLIPIAFNLRGREGGAMPELDPDGLACQRASSGGSSRSYVAIGLEPSGQTTVNHRQPSQTTVNGSQSVATFQQSSMDGKGTIGYDTSGLAKPCKTQADGQMIHAGYAVRRLTPRECERLQGFPDDYTRIPWRGKAADQCPDGPRYKALGNSMAVPVITWLGQRLLLTRSTTPQSAPLETAH